MLGKARLHGLRDGGSLGDEILVRRPKGELRCAVLAIRYEE